jgi:hypothetical protein
LQVAGIAVNRQIFAVANQLSADFYEETADGIMGLGWPALANSGADPPFQNMMPQLDIPVFVVWLLKFFQAFPKNFIL